MKKTLKMVFIFFVFISCTNTPNRSAEKNIFSDTGLASFQNEEYTIISVLVNDLQKTLEIWNIQDSQGFPKISSIAKIKRNEPISIFLVYSTVKDSINMTYDLSIFRPDGTFSRNSYKGLTIEKGNGSNRLLRNARELPTIIFDETDQFGTYQFHIPIYDNNKLIETFIMEFELIE